MKNDKHLKLSCNKCDSTDVEMRHCYYGIPTGYWCDSCYNSNKYPYRKDRYSTIEFDGFGEQLNPD
jgi:hypothetical protein